VKWGTKLLENTLQLFMKEMNFALDMNEMCGTEESIITTPKGAL